MEEEEEACGSHLHRADGQRVHLGEADGLAVHGGRLLDHDGGAGLALGPGGRRGVGWLGLRQQRVYKGDHEV